MKNLGYILFFVIYTAYIDCYRSTSVLLILFISFFIWAQYFLALFHSSVFKDPMSKLWIDRL